MYVPKLPEEIEREQSICFVLLCIMIPVGLGTLIYGGILIFQKEGVTAVLMLIFASILAVILARKGVCLHLSWTPFEHTEQVFKRPFLPKGVVRTNVKNLYRDKNKRYYVTIIY